MGESLREILLRSWNVEGSWCFQSFLLDVNPDYVVARERDLLRRRTTNVPFFFFNDPAPTEISPLSLPHALPIYFSRSRLRPFPMQPSFVSFEAARLTARCSSDRPAARRTSIRGRRNASTAPSFPHAPASSSRWNTCAPPPPAPPPR